MRRIGNIVFALVAAMGWSCLALAQDATFYASVDKNPVGVGDVFTIKFTIENGRGEISPPSFSDFDVAYGPSTSSSFQFINGRQSSTMTLSYGLRPRAEGKYTLAAASARVGSNTYKSEPITIEVVKGSSAPAAQPARPPGAGQPQPQQQQSSAAADNNFLVRTQLSKSKVYQGEGLLVSFVLLSRYNNIDLGESTFPTLNGFWTEEIKTGAVSWENEYEYVKGVPYRKAVLRQQLLFPQRAGTIEIEPFKLTARVNRSLFSPGSEVKAESYVQNVEVLPLPAGAPESFNGAVGEYTFTGQVGKTELQANDAIDLMLNIKGKGNLRLTKAPTIDFPSDFEVYDPEIKDRIAVSTTGMSGSRNYGYLVIPRYPGKYVLPAVEFTHFNPSSQKYVTERIGPFDISVSGEDGLIPETRGAVAKSRVEPMRRDIRYIETGYEKLRARGSAFYGSAWYYVLIGAPLFLLVGLVIFNRKREAIFGDVKSNRRKRAQKQAMKRLSLAKTAMDKGQSKAFYAEIFSALYGFLSDKLGTERAELTKPRIKEYLAQSQVPEHIIEEAIHIIEQCEMARFAPIEGLSDQMFYSRVVDFIEKMEAHFK